VRWLDALGGGLEPWELEELDDPGALEDAFAGDLRFGTGGIRCLMGVGPNRMNRLTIGKAAQGLAHWLKASQASGDQRSTVAIGYDTRFHSREFAEATACVLAANGIAVRLFDAPQPTPVLSFAVRELACAAGVVLTASHNPREYNGFKVYDAQGVQATDAMAHAIQDQIEQVDPFADVRIMGLDDALASGMVSYVAPSLLDAYHDAVMAQRLGVDCAGLRVVYSPLNGTGLVPAQRALAAIGATCSLVEGQSAPDGNFPLCPKPNPENPSAMEAGMAQMATEGADLFLATDPDADRVGVACMDAGRPRLLTGNEVGLLLFDYLCRSLPTATGAAPIAVTTVVSAPLADTIAEHHGVELRRTLTGFKYVGEQIGLIEGEGRCFLLGLEESDGYLRGGYVRDKDGICALTLVCELAAYYKHRGLTLVDALVELNGRYGHMPGRQLTVAFPGEAGRAAMSALMSRLRTKRIDTIANLAVERTIDYLPGAPMPVVGGASEQTLPPSDVLEWRLAGGSRVLVRPSGTEPKLKAYVFAKAGTAAEAEMLLEELCVAVSALLGEDQKPK
jgi:phosphoglucomutase